MYIVWQYDKNALNMLLSLYIHTQFHLQNLNEVCT